MHRQTLVALSWCLVIGAAIALLLEVHRSHAQQPPAQQQPITTTHRESSMQRGPEPEPQAATEVNYRGSIKSKKFHRKGCSYFSCTNCTATFATREEALKAHFDPCGTCKP
ncbi:MAG TPA: hypothetical protein VGF48_20975 [Thermoanaerobaculia bacterium]|jgi:hypothetical protein